MYNEEELKALHAELKIKADFGQWVSDIENDNKYLQGMYRHLKVEDSFDDWRGSLFGDSEPKPSSPTPENTPENGVTKKKNPSASPLDSDSPQTFSGSTSASRSLSDVPATSPAQGEAVATPPPYQNLGLDSPPLPSRYTPVNYPKGENKELYNASSKLGFSGEFFNLLNGALSSDLATRALKLSMGVDLAYQTGRAQAATIPDAISIWGSGANVKKEVIDRYIESRTQAGYLPSSAASKNFEKISKEKGGGVWGFLMALKAEPQVAIENLVSSYTMMNNEASIKAGSVPLIWGGGKGLSRGIVAPIPEARAKALFMTEQALQGAVEQLPYAFALAGGALELGMSFNLFLDEELEKAGLPFDETGVMTILQDADALERIRVKSAKRAGVIGGTDLLFGFIGMELRGFLPAGARREVATVATQMVGGGLGETGAMLGSGQELNANEIGFETLLGGTGAVPVIVGAAARGIKPSAKINGQPVRTSSVLNILDNPASAEIIHQLNIEVLNAPELQTLLDDKKLEFSIEKAIGKEIEGENREKLVKLELERSKLIKSDLKSDKIKLKQIDEDISLLLEDSKRINEDKLQKVEILPATPLDNITDRDKAIKQAQKDEGLTTSRFSIVRAIEKRWKQAFSDKDQKPISMRGHLENREARVLGLVSEIHQAHIKYERILRKIKKRKGSVEVTVKAFEDIINGEIVSREQMLIMPLEAVALASEMRQKIDNFQRIMVENGYVSEEAAESLIDNDGNYLTRAYRVFTESNWDGKISDNKRAIGEKFLTEMLSDSETLKRAMLQDPQLSEEEVLKRLVQQHMEELQSPAKAMQTGKKFKEGAKDTKNLKKKTDIPKELRGVMGEYTDPFYNVANTLITQMNIISSGEFLERVKADGEGVYLFNEGDLRPEGYNTRLSGDTDESLGPLAGMYTSKAIAESFESPISNDNRNPYLSKVTKFYKKFVGLAKYNKTILSVEGHGKNAFGGGMFLVANGYTDFSRFPSIAATVFDRVANTSNTELEAKYNSYVRKGLARQGTAFLEAKEALGATDWSNLMSGLKEGIPFGALYKLKQKLKNTPRLLEEIYQGVDDIYRISIYESEADMYAKAMFDGRDMSQLSYSEQQIVDNIAIEHAKNIYPNYNRIGKLPKALGQSFVLTSFISFQVESIRSASNISSLIAEELKSPNAAIRDIGRKRALGLSSYLAGKKTVLASASKGLGYGYGGLMGRIHDTDEEKQNRKDVKLYSSSWTKNTEMHFNSRREGYVSYTDVGTSDPFGGIEEVLEAATSEEETLDVFLTGLETVFTQFVTEDMVLKTLREVRENEDERIFNSEDPFFKRSKDITAYMTKKLQPTTINTAKKWGETDDAGKELLSLMTGMKQIEIDFAKSFSFKAGEYDKRFLAAKKILNDKRYIGNQKLAFADYKEVQVRLLREINEYYNAALRQGADPKKLLKSIEKIRSLGNYEKSQIFYKNKNDIEGTPYDNMPEWRFLRELDYKDKQKKDAKN